MVCCRNGTHHKAWLARTVARPAMPRGESLAAYAERHEGALVNDGLGLLVGPALRHESQRLRPVPRVALEAVDGHPDDDVAGDVGAVGKGDAFGWSLTLDAGGDLIRLV